LYSGIYFADEAGRFPFTKSGLLPKIYLLTPLALKFEVFAIYFATDLNSAYVLSNFCLDYFSLISSVILKG